MNDTLFEQVSLLARWNKKNIDADTEQVRKNIDTMFQCLVLYENKKALETVDSIVEEESPTMLTIDETAECFNLPKYFVRQAIANGKVPSVQSGRKHLINAVIFKKFLNDGESYDYETEISDTRGEIRRSS